MVAHNPTPSDQLLKEVRAALILKGFTLSSFCQAHKLTRQNVSAALSGKWRGPKAEYLVKRVVTAVHEDAA